MPILRRFMSVVLLSDVERSDDPHEDFLEILFSIAVAKFGERTLCKELAGLDNPDDVAELFDLAHDMRGENDSLATLTAFADEFDDGSSGHNVETECRLIEDHDLR